MHHAFVYSLFHDNLLNHIAYSKYAATFKALEFIYSATAIQTNIRTNILPKFARYFKAMILDFQTCT